MKKLLFLTRLFMCLFAGLSSTTAFAAAGWVGAGVINVNGTWYYADQHESTTWASGAFTNQNFVFFTTQTTLTIGGQVQLWDENSAEWGEGSTATMYYKIDNSDYASITLTKYKFENNKNYFQSGGSNFTTSTIDISSLSLGAHTLTVKFEDVDGLKPTAEYTANFTKAIDISGATVSGVDASYDWTGSVIHPVPVVKLGETVLNSTSDYDVTYSDGRINVGDYTVTITGKGNYAGTKVVPFTINNVYFLVGSMTGWQRNQSYKLVANAEAEGEYYINGVELDNNVNIKVQSAEDVWFPDGYDNDYVITAAGTYDIYFRPNYDGGDDWYCNCIYAADVTPIDYGETVEVTLAPTGYGTYYNGGKMVTLPTGVVAYAVSDVTGDQPTYVEIADGDSETNNTVPAATAVLLYCDTKPEKITLTLTDSENSYSGTNLLHGSDDATTTTGGGNGAKYYKLTYGSVSGHESIFGWYWGADNGGVFTSPAHKAWLVLPANANNNARAFFNLPDDDATGIASVVNKQQNADNVWYDLNGRRIKAPTTKGIYIKDGRKLVIK